MAGRLGSTKFPTCAVGNIRLYPDHADDAGERRRYSGGHRVLHRSPPAASDHLRPQSHRRPQPNPQPSRRAGASPLHRGPRARLYGGVPRAFGRGVGSMTACTRCGAGRWHPVIWGCLADDCELRGLTLRADADAGSPFAASSALPAVTYAGRVAPAAGGIFNQGAPDGEPYSFGCEMQGAGVHATCVSGTEG